MSFFDFKREEVTPGTDNRQKRAIFRYFEVLFRSFSKIVLLNLCYALCVAPLFVGLITAACIMFGVSPEIIQSMFFVHLSVWITGILPRPLFLVLFFASAFVYGPMTAGLTYCMRNLITGRHVFISDLFDCARSNLKQGIIFGFIDIFVLLSVLLYVSADLSAITSSFAVYYKLGKIFSLIIAVLYLCIRFYSYTIAVTFELRIRDILKNSWLFCILGFFRNILSVFIIFVLVSTCISTSRIDIVLFATVFFGVSRFSVLFTTYPIIEKYMLKQANNEEK